ncbi:Rieske 2Fe-2S domain-containing protein [Breoghania sp.]|uniref:Rieske 2Fe-2S domain-containing protein n=1 Tax=Breoghania sp. TaxID=2065378 RepID=UPI002AAAC673|nr:Rieske 2Fe-2S domain-containing protein [Breoghania sp.]
MSQFKDQWAAVALSADVGRKPKRIFLNGVPIVLFRGRDGVAALPDRCPHRLVALSEGRVVDGDIECPYHGWRFNGDGRCTAIPGHIGKLPVYRTQTYRTMEREGAIFVSAGSPAQPPYVHCMEGQDVVVRRVRSSTQSTVLDAAENILDATHTHFTHKNLLRGLSAKRHKVTVEITGGEGWIQADYIGENRQEGIVSKLLEGERTRTVGRFRAPGIAELEYWGPKGLALATTFHLRRADAETVEGIGWLMGPRKGGLGHLMALAFKPLFSVALNQDRRVLRSASLNSRFTPDARPVIGPLDFLRKDIEAILKGEPHSAMEVSRRASIEL